MAPTCKVLLTSNKWMSKSQPGKSFWLPGETLCVGAQNMCKIRDKTRIAQNIQTQKSLSVEQVAAGHEVVSLKHTHTHYPTGSHSR